ncbi:8259_t:CDS:2, partial [Acaulospora morrowiae]
IGWYIARFNVFWRNPSSHRDMGIEGLFAILWVISGIINIFPYYESSMCTSGNTDYATRCRAYFSSLACGWANAL